MCDFHFFTFSLLSIIKCNLISLCSLNYLTGPNYYYILRRYYSNLNLNVERIYNIIIISKLRLIIIIEYSKSINLCVIEIINLDKVIAH